MYIYFGLILDTDNFFIEEVDIECMYIKKI